MTPTIRDAQAEDADRLADFNIRMALETEYKVLDPDTVRSGVRAVFADPAKGRFFVAELSGQVVAQLLITHEWSDWRNGDIWWIQSVYVHPDHRRRGVFRALYHHVRDQARSASAVSLRLYVEQKNQGAQQTYQALGMHLHHYFIMEETLQR